MKPSDAVVSTPKAVCCVSAEAEADSRLRPATASHGRMNLIFQALLIDRVVLSRVRCRKEVVIRSCVELAHNQVPRWLGRVIETRVFAAMRGSKSVAI